MPVSSPDRPVGIVNWFRDMARMHGRPLLLIFLLSLPLFFFYLGGWGFFDPDEGRYAEIPREMIERGDFITPTLNYVNYFEKPPLMYWAVAASFKVFGFTEWAARLIPVLAALAGLVMTYALGRRMFGCRAGTMSAVILITMVMWPIMARLVIIDMLFSVLLFVALGFWWMGQAEDEEKPAPYFLAFWATLALAVMAKGPVAVILAGGTILPYLAISRRWKVLSQMRWLAGVPLFLLITAPWFILVAERNPSFNNYFWYGQNVARFLGKGENREHVESFSFFFKLLPLALFPWTLFMPGAFFAARKFLWPVRTEKQRAAWYLLCIPICTTLFFSASTSKLLSYILPVLPPVAILIGFYFERLSVKSATAWRAPLYSGVALLIALLAAAAIATLVVNPAKILRKAEIGPGALHLLGVLLLLWAAALIYSVWRRKVNVLVVSVAGGCAVLVTGFMPVIASMAEGQTSKSLLAALQPGLNAKAEVITYDGYGQSLNFYLRRRLKINGDIGELKGMRDLPAAESKLWFTSGIADLRHDMNQSGPVYCVVKNRDAAGEALKALGGSAAITGNRKFFVIGNAAALALTPPDLAALDKYPPSAMTSSKPRH